MATIRLPSLVQTQGIRCVNTKLLPYRTRSMMSPSFTWNKMKVDIVKPYVERRWLIKSVGDGVDSEQPNRYTASDVIAKFYECLNEKNLKKLKEFISEDCCFEDYTFVKPFTGKKEVMHFYQKLMEAMGKNVKFSIENISQGDNLSVAVTWHLEWKGKIIPFTRGCNFYECTKQGDKLLINRSRAMVESPIKPGTFSLALFKVVTYLFDEFPGVAEKFLEKPQVILEFLQRVYVIFLEPFVKPVMEFYITCWKFVVRILGYMLNILLHISKMFLQ
ncbi:hypothetical protein ACHQM5_011531 [Ranunculus cassubicifolius]